MTPIELKRVAYKPKHPGINLQKSKKKLKVAVLFSGGPASGGHNVLWGLFDALKEIHPENSLLGIRQGMEGLLAQDFIELQPDLLASFHNQGGFDLLLTSRKKLKKEDFPKIEAIFERHKIDALVVIGGDDSNTNAFYLAEYSNKQVIGVPKTIDGDLRNKAVPITFGFDTATTVYAELVQNLIKDTRSCRKYWHFVKLMGRSASHVTLRVATKTHAHIALIAEEVKLKGWKVEDIVDYLSCAIKKRQDKGKNYGVVLIPEGLAEFVPEFQKGIEEKDAHGNINLSIMDTHKILSDSVSKKLEQKIDVIHHFYGYEGRCALPTDFDCDLGYSLGRSAANVVSLGKTGVMVGTKEFIELKSLMKNGVIEKALVDLKEDEFLFFEKNREEWLLC